MYNADIRNAFKSMESLNEDTDFKLNSEDGIEELDAFFNDDEAEEDDKIEVFDSEAETEDEIKDNYIGKAICDCVVCHSLVYKDPEEIVLEDEDTITEDVEDKPSLANVGDECPYCFSSEGYHIVGQVCPFNPASIKDDEFENSFEIETEGPAGEAAAKAASDAFGAKMDELNDEDEFDDISDPLGERKERAKHRESLAKKISKYNRLKENKSSYNKKRVDEDITYITDDEAYRIFNSPYLKEGDYTKYIILDPEEAPGKVLAVDYRTGDEDEETFKYFDTEEEAISWLDSLGESLSEAVHLEADGEDKVTLDKNDDGSMTINVGADDEFDALVDGPQEGMITPVDDKFKAEIEDNEENIDDDAAMLSDEEVPAEENEFEPSPLEDEVPEDEEEVDVPMDDFVEESFNQLGEGYLKKVYNNVKSFSTTNVTESANGLVVEGKIEFMSGKTKKTSFIFEAKTATKSGKVKFLGENQQITRGKKAFTLTGNVKDKKFVAEALTYNYTTKDVNNNSQKLYGTIRKEG